MSVGMQTYARELTDRLPRIARDLQFITFGEGENFSWAEQVTLPLSMRRARLQLTHFLSLYMPLAAAQPYVVTIHDLIHLRFPQYFKAKVAPYYRTAVRFACRRAATVITDDERTVADLERYLSVPPSRVRVIPLGADARFGEPREPFSAPLPYLMYAGNHRPHKDLETLFSAWALLPETLAMDLYLTGHDELGAHGRYGRAQGRIIFLGDVPVERLAALYAGACAVVHPALAEGFGLPLLEAMSAGCPVVACVDAVPSPLLPAALTFPARDARAAAFAIRRLVEDEGLRTRLVNQGRACAAPLTWDRCARSTADLYREILEERRT